MVAAFWQPKEEEFNEIYGLLEQQITRPADSTWTVQQFQCKFPDLNNYLAFILSRAEGKSPVVRQGAGLLLKNNLKSTFESMPAANQGYIKLELLHCLKVADRQIKSTVATTISVLVQLGGVSGWPDLLQALVICLDSNDVNHMECAMDALLKICEDIPQVLSLETPGSSEPPINFFLPRLFQLFQSPNALLRQQSVKSVNQYIKLMPTVLHMSMDQYVQGLFGLCNDPDPEVRVLVCPAFRQLIKVFPDSFAPHLQTVIECVLQLNKDPDESVAMGACEIWTVYYSHHLPQENLQEFLPRLIQVLLTNLVYHEVGDSLVDSEEDGFVPGRNPNRQCDEVLLQYDEAIGRWTLRKCSVDALEFISVMFGNKILPTLMPVVRAKLSTSDDATWKEREAAVLALGTIAGGCFRGLYPHLSEIVDFLCQRLNDKFPLIRSISCWALSRFGKFIVKEIGHEGGQERFDNVLAGLLERMLDDNKRVQASACSTFLILAEKTKEEWAPCLGNILQRLTCAFEKFQPEHLDVLMPPLVSKWQQLPDSNRDLYSLLQCFKFMAQALGGRFSQFAQAVFQRCINIIQTRKLAKVHSASAGAHELVVFSLDLISGLVGSLESGADSLVSESNLRNLLLQCCKDDAAADVRESAFALLGRLVRVCPTHLQPRPAEFFDLAAKQLKVLVRIKKANSEANRACQAIGELAIKVREEVRPSVTRVLPCLYLILRPKQTASTKEINTSLRESSAITLGRLAWVFPDLVSPSIHRFIEPWCIALSMLCDSVMKEEAFRGLCAVVRANPSEVSTSLVFMLQAIASFQEIQSEDLRNEVSQILKHYQMLSNEEWEWCMSDLEEPVKNRLLQYLG